MNLCGKEVVVEGRLVRIAHLRHEGFEFLENPDAAIAYLRESGDGIDLFTFMTQLPCTSPKYDYAAELDNVAALPVSTFEHWWSKQIDGKTRNMVRRAENKGVVVREVSFDDTLVRGIWEIYNECPLRQGKPFPHYGKDVETVHRMSATFQETSIFIGAFLGEKLIGFMKLTCDDARSQAAVMHIVSMIQHRDKAPTNALIAQAVRSCADRGIPFLAYAQFSYGNKKRDGLAEFKHSNGFRQVDAPRYYVPMGAIGLIALRLGLHRGLDNYIPGPVLAKFRSVRSLWYKCKLKVSQKAF